MNIMQTRTEAQTKSTARMFFFMLLSFPLGLIFFVAVAVGLSVGLGTLVVWIGLPLLIGTLAMARGIGAIERSLARELLGVSFTEPRPRPGTQGILRWASSYMRDSLAWRSLLYIVVKFPICIAAFSLAISFVLTTIGLVLAPLGYLIATFVLQVNGIHLHNTSPDWLGFFNFDVNGQFEPLMFAKFFIISAVGIVFWLLTRALLRSLGAISGVLARAFLNSYEWEEYRTARPLSLPHEDGYYQTIQRS